MNVGVPGVRFGQSRNQRDIPGTSEGNCSTNESETMKGVTKKHSLTCEGCSVKFSVWRRKKECVECRRMFCSQCLTKVLANGGGWCLKDRNQVTCPRCLVILAKPPSRFALLGLRTRDLQAYLASHKIPTHGCLEKDDLVNLIIHLTHSDATSENSYSARPNPRGNSFDVSHSDAVPDSSRNLSSSSPGHEGSARPPVHSNTTRSAASSTPIVGTKEGTTSHEMPEERVLQNESSIYPQLPTEDTIVEGVTHNCIPQDFQPSEQIPRSGTSNISDPTRGGGLPGSLYDEDWEIVEHEVISQRPLNPSPPSSHGATLTSSSQQPITIDLNTSSSPVLPGDGNPIPLPQLSSNPASEHVDPDVIMSSSSPSAPLAENFSSTSSQNTREPSDNNNIQSSSSNHLSSSTNRPSASIHGYSSPLKAPQDIASMILSSTNSMDDLSLLSVKQLKELLTSSRVDYRGCCEKKELLDRAQRLWQEYKAAASVNSENLSEDIVCKVCMDAPIDCVMLECGHMATCTLCGKRMSECPICRQYVVRIVRIFKA